jgi:Flp pilus assembly protein TadG
MRIAHGERGQASVELVALLPLLLAVALALFQLLLVGASAWFASTAARDAARASALGDDPRTAAASAVPAPFRRGLAVHAASPGVRVHLTIPTLTGVPLGSTSATASMEPQR